MKKKINKQWFNEDVISFWEKYSEGCISYKYMFTLPMIKIIEEKYGTIKDKKGLDFGCGLGRNIGCYTDAGAEIIGFDINEGYLSKNSKQNPNILFTSDMDSILDSSLDFVVSTYCMTTLDNESFISSLEILYKKLKNGGTIILGRDNWSECGGKETLTEYYPEGQPLSNGKRVSSYLKIGGVMFGGNLKYGEDYIEVIDYYRTKEYVDEIFRKTGFTDVRFTYPSVPKKPERRIIDEKTTNIYELVVAIK